MARSKWLTIRVDEDDMRVLKRDAAESGRTVSDLVRDRISHEVSEKEMLRELSHKFCFDESAMIDIAIRSMHFQHVVLNAPEYSPTTDAIRAELMAVRRKLQMDNLRRCGWAIDAIPPLELVTNVKVLSEIVVDNYLLCKNNVFLDIPRVIDAALAVALYVGGSE
jgi:hypothetical protein